MPSRRQRRKSLRRSFGVVPPTPGTVIPLGTPGNVAGAQPDVASPKINRKVASFYGSGLPRPGLMADPERAARHVVKSQRGRVEFVSPVQPLMEWAVSVAPKDGGVAPQWAGKPPRKALTPQRAFLEDRRAALLADNPDLRLLTYPEQIRLATKESGRIFENLPNVNQEKYRQYAAADEKRYEAECEAYEAANPGWRSYEARRAAAKAAQQAARLPPAPPPSAEQMFVEAWLQQRDPEAAGAGGEALGAAEEAAVEAWEQASNGERAVFELQAKQAHRQHEVRLAQWKERRESQRAARAAMRTAPRVDVAGEEEKSSSSDEEEEDTAAVEAALAAAAAAQAPPLWRGGGGGAAAAAKVPKAGGSARATRSARKGAPAEEANAAEAAAAPALETSAGKRKQGEKTPAKAPPAKRAKSASPKRAETEAEGIAMAEMRALADQKEAGGRPGKFPAHPEQLVGAKVINTFALDDGGEETFTGRVTEYLLARITGQGISPLWSVEYADGDAGEAEWFELKELLTSWPPKGL